MSASDGAPLRILHVLDHSLPLHSGYSFRSAAILRCEAARGWSVAAITSSKHEESWRRPAPNLETIDGIRYYRSGASATSRIPLLSEARLMHRLERRILEVASAERPDLIHAHSPVLNAFPALDAGKALGVPVVYEIRAFWEDAAADHGTYARGSLRYRVVRAAETRAARRADQVVVICDGLRKDLIARGIPDAKLAISWNGIDLSEFETLGPDVAFAREHGLEGKRVLGFIGSFYGYEGLDLLLEATARLRVRRPDVALLLAGGGPMEAKLRERIPELGLTGSVVMPGRVPHERVTGLYGIVDILVYPRYSTRLTELVTPLKPLEAMAMGKPFVASDIGGHRELIEDRRTGLLVPPGDPDALARGIETLLDDGALRARLVEAGRRWVRERHPWSRTTAVYPEVYARALARPAPSSRGVERPRPEES